MDTPFTTGNGAIPLVTPEEIDQAEQATIELLAQIAYFCGAVQIANGHISQGANSEHFFNRTWERYQALTHSEKVHLKNGSGEVDRLIRLATANSLRPIRFRDDHALTAHESVYMIAVNVLHDYGIDLWDELEEREGRPYPERSRRRDCRRLAKALQDATPELLRDLQARVEAETIQAKRFLIDHPSAMSATPADETITSTHHRPPARL